MDESRLKFVMRPEENRAMYCFKSKLFGCSYINIDFFLRKLNKIC